MPHSTSFVTLVGLLFDYYHVCIRRTSQIYCVEVKKIPTAADVR